MIRSNKNKKKKGFTLVEIIAVIAIIGILAAVLVPSVLGYIKEAKKTEVIDQARKVVTAAKSIELKTGKNYTEEDKDDYINTLTLENVADMSGALIVVDELDKIQNADLEDCVQILNSEKYTFSVDKNGELESGSVKTIESN